MIFAEEGGALKSLLFIWALDSFELERPQMLTPPLFRVS